MDLTTNEHNMTKDLKRAFLSTFVKLCFVSLFLGCSDDVTVKVTTGEVTSIKSATAKCSGMVQIEGNENVIARGVCWDSNSVPTISSSKTTDGTGSGSFVSSISGLSPKTTYKVRAYSTTNSGTTYGKTLSFTTKQGEVVTDIDGNVYNTVTIGTQVWFLENLNVTRFNDGTEIPLVSSNDQWAKLQTAGYCWVDNKLAYRYTYGALYNWYAVETGKLCPAGWHVPTRDDWIVLTDYLGGESVAGGIMKETNDGDFAALLPGYRNYFSGTFDNKGNYGYWWSSSPHFDEASAVTINVNVNFGSAPIGIAFKSTGISVRCVKD